uniref:Uncharacterized protein n=1 Tax=viral metagenome TaxID=1070528 RepID=A0A6C0B1P0_9ZZZZ
MNLYYNFGYDFDFDFEHKKPSPKHPREYPRRLKCTGTDLEEFYNKLALRTIGHIAWEQMRLGGYGQYGRLNWSMIPDEHFRSAELLAKQLEVYDPNETTEEKEEDKEEANNDMTVLLPAEPLQPVKKQKKKRDRRIKVKSEKDK